MFMMQQYVQVANMPHGNFNQINLHVTSTETAGIERVHYLSKYWKHFVPPHLPFILGEAHPAQAFPFSPRSLFWYRVSSGPGSQRLLSKEDERLYVYPLYNSSRVITSTK